MMNLKFTPEEMKGMSFARDLKAANYKVIGEKDGEAEIEVSYDHTYTGTLEFYFETGMEGVSCNVHDDRGWHESPSWNNETKKMDGPNESYKSLEWSVFIRGGEYLTIFGDKEEIIWEGILFRDTNPSKDKHHYHHHFLPLDISYADWFKWCNKEYRAEIQTNEPVLAEQEDYINDYKKQEDPTILKGTK